MELLKAIEAEAERRCQDARESAETEIRRIHDEAEQQIRAAREAAREESLRRIGRQETVLVSQAETNVQRENAVAKSELLQQALDRARERLADVVASDQYPAVFELLAREALAEINRDFTAVVRPEDETLARAALERLGAADFSLQTNGRFLGGLVVESRDGRSRVVNTLDARFERARDEAVLRLAPLLFG